MNAAVDPLLTAPETFRPRLAMLALAALLLLAATARAADSPPSKAPPPEAPPQQQAPQPPSSSVPGKDARGPAAPPPEAPATAAPASSPVPARRPRQTAAQPPRRPVPAAASEADAVRELALARSVEGAALNALYRAQQRAKEAADMEAALDSGSPPSADVMRNEAWQLEQNVPEAGSAAIEAGRLEDLARRLPRGPRRKEVRQEAARLRLLAGQLTQTLADARAAAKRLKGAAGVP